MTDQIGFIGLGRMGLPMAYNLLRAGYGLSVHNRSQAKVRQIADAGATAAASAAAIMAGGDLVLACLPDVATCETVLLDEALPHARPGQVIVDHSTVGAATSQACADAAAARGAMFLDAPISGGTERSGKASPMAPPRAGHYRRGQLPQLPGELAITPKHAKLSHPSLRPARGRQERRYVQTAGRQHSDGLLVLAHD